MAILANSDGWMRKAGHADPQARAVDAGAGHDGERQQEQAERRRSGSGSESRRGTSRTTSTVATNSTTPISSHSPCLKASAGEMR